MKAITNLTGQLTELDYREPRGVVTTLHSEATPGVHLKIFLGAAGLVVRRGEIAVAVPLNEIITAAAALCPELLEITGEKPAVALTPLQKKIAQLVAAKKTAKAPAAS